MILFYPDFQKQNSPLIQTGFLAPGIKASSTFVLVKELWSQKVIDFVPCVGISIVGKCQMTAISFDSFPKFQLTFRASCCRYFLLRGLNVKQSVFVWLFELKLIHMVVALDSWLSKKTQRLFLLTNLNLQTHFFSGLKNSFTFQILELKVLWHCVKVLKIPTNYRHVLQNFLRGSDYPNVFRFLTNFCNILTAKSCDSSFNWNTFST